jgi:hypothetical protein
VHYTPLGMFRHPGIALASPGQRNYQSLTQGSETDMVDMYLFLEYGDVFV